MSTVKSASSGSAPTSYAPQPDAISAILAFRGDTLLAAGPVPQVAQQLQALMAQGEAPNFLLFNADNGQQIDIELGASLAHIEQRYGAAQDAQAAAASAARKSRGRPKLGVIGREVTLLPRHWQWLDRQRGGASAALRRLIDSERRNTADEDRVRQAQDSTNRFLYAMAGNQAGFEEAVRALYAGDQAGFAHHIRHWPADIKRCTANFAKDAFANA